MIKFKSQKLFSTQQALDCLNPSIRDGLTPGHVFNYYKTSGGVATQASYPTTASQGYECLFNYTMDGIQIVGATGYERVQANDEAQLKQAVRQKGPTSVMFQVNNDFLSYSDGVYQASDVCLIGANTITHALLVVGFGTDLATGLDYWLVQNSWGQGWG